MTAITVNDLTLGYEGHAAVHHLSGRFEGGSMTAIIGPNGSGKSTLLKGLAGFLKPMHGHIAQQPGDIAWLPQQGSLDPSFPATVEDLVVLGLWRKRGWFTALNNDDRHNVDHALASVGLSGFATRTVESLSGGQVQRALFARLYLQDCAVMLLDEPFTAIDRSTVDDIMALLHQWQAKGRTIIAVLHDYDLARKHFPHTLLLARERIAWGRTSDVLTPENLDRARTMHEAWDDNAPWCHKDVA